MGVQTCIFPFSMTQIIIILPSFSVVQISWASNPGRLRVGVGGGEIPSKFFVATNAAMQHNILEEWGTSTPSSSFHRQ